MARQMMRVAHATQMVKTLKRAAELAGGWTALAHQLSQEGPRVSKQGVHVWLQRGVPVERAMQIEQVLGGVITRDELRPDLYQGYRRVEE
jgi:DNA-binding transcriptional regulator YdaS (Cro superfamily)